MSTSGSLVSPNHFEFANVIVKPDGMRAKQTSYIRMRILEAGLIIVSEKRCKITEKQAEKHYDKSDAWCERFGKKRNEQLRQRGEEARQDDLACGREILAQVQKGLTDGTSCLFIVYGKHANAIMRDIAGPTDPEEARRANKNHIRALSPDSMEKANEEMRPVLNMIHVSETEEEALREIKNLWPGLLRLFRHLLGVPPDALHNIRVFLEDATDPRQKIGAEYMSSLLQVIE